MELFSGYLIMPDITRPASTAICSNEYEIEKKLGIKTKDPNQFLIQEKKDL